MNRRRTDPRAPDAAGAPTAGAARDRQSDGADFGPTDRRGRDRRKPPLSFATPLLAQAIGQLLGAPRPAAPYRNGKRPSPRPGRFTDTRL